MEHYPVDIRVPSTLEGGKLVELSHEEVGPGIMRPIVTIEKNGDRYEAFLDGPDWQVRKIEKPITWKVVNTFNGATEQTGLTKDFAFTLADKKRNCAPCPEDWIYKYSEQRGGFVWMSPDGSEAYV